MSGFASGAHALFSLHGSTSHTIYKEIQVGTRYTNFFTKTLSVVWQTHCPCKEKHVVVCRRNHPSRLCLCKQVLVPELLWGHELWTFLYPWRMCLHHGFFEMLCALSARGCNSRRACSCQEHIYSGILLLAILAGVTQRGDFTLAGKGSFCWLVSTLLAYISNAQKIEATNGEF